MQKRAAERAEFLKDLHGPADKAVLMIGVVRLRRMSVAWGWILLMFFLRQRFQVRYQLPAMSALIAAILLTTVFVFLLLVFPVLPRSKSP